MELDQVAITELEGRDVDVPFRNLWSDHVWLGTAEVRGAPRLSTCRH